MDSFLTFSVCIFVLSGAFAVACFGMSLVLNAQRIEPKKDEE